MCSKVKAGDSVFTIYFFIIFSLKTVYVFLFKNRKYSIEGIERIHCPSCFLVLHGIQRSLDYYTIRNDHLMCGTLHDVPRKKSVRKQIHSSIWKNVFPSIRQKHTGEKPPAHIPASQKPPVAVSALCISHDVGALPRFGATWSMSKIAYLLPLSRCPVRELSSFPDLSLRPHHQVAAWHESWEEFCLCVDSLTSLLPASKTCCSTWILRICSWLWLPEAEIYSRSHKTVCWGSQSSWMWLSSAT